MAHAHALQHDALPTPDQLAALVTRGAWLELAAAMKLGNLSIPLPPESWAAWGWAPLDDAPEARITMLGATSSDRVVLVEGLSSLAPLRRLAMASRRHNPTVELLWWCVLDDALVAATVDEDDMGRPFMRTIQVDRASPRRAQLDKLLALSPLEDARPLRQRTRDVMRQETLTRAFFKGFQRCFTMLRDQILDGPRQSEERHDVALLVMLRLVVLYFLQSRGALDGEKRYLANRLAAHASTNTSSFWEETLRPLFFGVLNRPRHTRSTSAKMLGRMPFLNGGLFEPSAIERAHPDLTWDDEVWHRVIQEFFETYRFALAEPTGSDEHDAIDPEVLGKVFEGLMYGDRRNTSGSFYTPRGLVTEMVERAILGHLATHLGVEDAILTAWLTTHEERDQEPVTIDAAALREALEELTILDPAAGTGAFLMEALQLLRALWGRLRACGEEGPDPDTYAGVRQMIHDHLHGVDRDVTAIRLCELRFWLALLGTLPRDLSAMIHKLEPLPNLGHKFSPGDSLLSALDLHRARDASGSAWSAELSRDAFSDLVDEITSLHERHLMSHGAAKQALRVRLEDRERELFERILTARSERLRERMKPLELLASSKDLFDRPTELTPSQREELDNLQKEIAAIEDLCGRAEGSPGFCFELRFARVMARGGFHIVITNPPWVRATKQDPMRKKLYAGRYASCEGKLWRDARGCGVRATFGNQVDLATLFIERSLELLATHGRLCALVPAKLLRALHGAGLRGVMAEHHLIGVEDLSGSERHLFDATTYPMILELQKRERRGARQARAPRRSLSSRREPTHARFGLWSAQQKTTWRAPMESLLSIGADAREPWMLAPPELEATFEVMRKAPEKLGEHEALRPRRGVLTGCNAAFVRKADAMLEAFGHDRALMLAHTRPVFQGRHISAWTLRTDERILWPYDESLRLYQTLPAPACRLLEPHRDRLEQRSDMKRGQPWWRLYRVQDGVDGPKVVWRDLAPWMEATPCLDGEIPLNTAYYIPCPDPLRAWGLCALLNSTPARCFLWALGERARGGWRRHFAWIVASLPIPARWSRWLSGTPDLELEALVQSFRAHPDGAARADALIARDYGIDRRALEDLQQTMAFHVKHAIARDVPSDDEVAA